MPQAVYNRSKRVESLGFRRFEMGTVTARKPGERISNKRSRDPYYDRRSGEDRRKAYSALYFLQGNKERRSFMERRTNVERRANYVRISEWSSMYLGPKIRKFRVILTDN